MPRLERRHYQVLTIFFKYAVSYFLIISIIFVTIGAYSYSSAIGANEQKVKSEIDSALRENVSAVDTGLYALAGTLTAICYDRDVMHVRRQGYPYPKEEYLALNELEGKLYSTLETSSYLESITVAFFDSKVMVSSQGVGVRDEDFYDLKLEPILGISYEEWRAALLGQEMGKMCFWSNGEQDLVQLSYLLPPVEDSSQACITMLLDPAIFMQSLAKTDFAATAALVVKDQGGKVFYSSAPEKSRLILEFMEQGQGYLAIDGVNYDCFTGKSELGLTYYLVVATDDIIAINSSIRIGFIWVYVVVLLVSVVLSMVFAVNLSKPIHSILSTIDENEAAGKGKRRGVGLTYINRSVSTMAERNTRLQREIDAYTAAMRDNFFYKLLGGDPITPLELRMVGDDVGRIFGFNSYAVALIQFYSYEDDEEKVYWEISTSMVLAGERLGAMEKDAVFIHKCSYDTLALILCGTKPMDRELLAKRLEPMIHTLMEATKMDFACAVGDLCENCDQIYISYQNACTVLGNQSVSRTGEISWTDSGSFKKLQLNFPVDTEQHLINAISIGNLEQAREIVDLLFESNRASLYVSRRQLSYFVSAMTVVFLRVQLSDVREDIAQKMNLYLWQMRNTTDVEGVHRYVYMLIDLLSSVAASRGEQRSKSQLEKIIAYIGAHFSEDTLCLSSIAKQFNLTESYVSTFFKQQTDSNISLYIEKVRMEHAKALVRTSGLPTKEIAARCGYQNLNTFYKAFKRNFGVSPKEFRNIPEQEE